MNETTIKPTKPTTFTPYEVHDAGSDCTSDDAALGAAINPAPYLLLLTATLFARRHMRCRPTFLVVGIKLIGGD
jgi:hypothetical protein